MTENLPDKIRGHHVPLLVRNLTREELGIMLTIDNFVNSPEHPFVDYVHSTLSALLQNPEHKIKIIYYSDFICQNCSKQNSCNLPKDKGRGEVWFLEQYYLQEPIEIGGEYTVKEICNAVNPDKWSKDHNIEEKLKRAKNNH